MEDITIFRNIKRPTRTPRVKSCSFTSSQLTSSLTVCVAIIVIYIHFEEYCISEISKSQVISCLHLKGIFHSILKNISIDHLSSSCQNLSVFPTLANDISASICVVHFLLVMY